MKHNDKGPLLPGEDDSWESLATNLFGIDFSKPAIPDEDVLPFDLSANLEPKVSKAPQSEEVPPDEDVQLTDAPEDDDDIEAGFPEDDEEEAEHSVELSAGVIKTDVFGGFDDAELAAEELIEEEPEELDAEAEELIEEDEEEVDTYWEALDEFQWDAEDDEKKSSAPKAGRRDSSRPQRSRDKGRDFVPARDREAQTRPGKKFRTGTSRQVRTQTGSRTKARPGTPRQIRRRSQTGTRTQTRTERERKSERPKEAKSKTREERAIIRDVIASAATYINEYDDSDFGLGLVEEQPTPLPSSRIADDEEEDLIVEETSDVETEEEEEASPDRKRRRRRRRGRKPREESSERETKTPAAKQEEQNLPG